MSEKWQEIYKPEEIKAIQRIEMDSLAVFAKVCKALNIEFFLYGGSLLGAVKYQGFVPWDDDLDVCLLRRDYDRLLREGPVLLPPAYELQEPTIHPVTPFPYAKFRRKDTVMVEYPFRKLPMNHGIYFDVYPIDNIPDDDEVYRQQHAKLQELAIRFLQRQSWRPAAPVSSPKEAILAGLGVAKHLRCSLLSHHKLVREMYEVMTAYNSQPTRRQGNYFYPEPVNFFDGVLPAVEVPFEGIMVKLPRGYQVNLENRYGDITQLPPEEERIGHRPWRLDLGKEASNVH